MIDVVELALLLLECAVVGAGMAIGDWAVKLAMVRWLNADVIPTDEEEEEEETKRKRRRRAKPESYTISEVP